jgi:hypothetical protein
MFNSEAQEHPQIKTHRHFSNGWRNEVATLLFVVINLDFPKK